MGAAIADALQIRGALFARFWKLNGILPISFTSAPDGRSRIYPGVAARL